MENLKTNVKMSKCVSESVENAVEIKKRIVCVRQQNVLCSKIECEILSLNAEKLALAWKWEIVLCRKGLIKMIRADFTLNQYQWSELNESFFFFLNMAALRADDDMTKSIDKRLSKLLNELVTNFVQLVSLVANKKRSVWTYFE